MALLEIEYSYHSNSDIEEIDTSNGYQPDAGYLSQDEYLLYITHGMIPRRQHIMIFHHTHGCSWIVDHTKCNNPCVPNMCYCKEHLHIPDYKRNEVEHITVCRKRIPYLINNTL